VPFAHGRAILSPSLPEVYDMNFLRAERDAPADELARAADVLMEDCFHRRVDAVGGGLGALGWAATPHLVMAHRREPDRRVDTSAIREVGHDELAPVRHTRILREPWAEPAVAEQIAEGKRRVAAATQMRHFAAVVDGEIAAYCELRSDGRTAQIEDVNTLEEFRGRGLGRALVQRALDDARATHDLVFLEALVDDWPRHLYTKLGFDVVDRRHLFLRPSHPLSRLRLRTPRLELRLATRAELRRLAERAPRGIDPPSSVDDFLARHEQQLVEWGAERWVLNLVAFHDGEPIGSQSLAAERFAEKRTLSTESWLGQPWRRQGLGAEMHAAVLELALRGLGGDVTASGAVAGDDTSAPVPVEIDGLEAVRGLLVA
jgi:ribosomal protein S18 acetylase RimI-like enzyme